MNRACYTVCCWIFMCRDFQVEFLSFFFEKLCAKYERVCNNVLLPCTVNVQHFVRSTRNVTHSKKYFLHKVSEMWIFWGYLFNMPPFIQFIFFEKLCVICEGIWSNVWLPCMVNMQHSVGESWLMCGSCAWLTCSIQCEGILIKVWLPTWLMCSIQCGNLD